MKNLFTTSVLAAALLLILSGSSSSGLGTPENYHRFELPFYAQPVDIVYDPAMVIPDPGPLTSISIVKSYRLLTKKPTRVLLNSLLEAKQRYELNDFLFYKLARTSLQVVYGDADQNAREITLFGLLVDAGFDARLTYRGNRVFVNVYTTEDLFEVPIIDTGGRPYANLSCLNGECSGRQRLFILDEHPNPRGRSFGFQLDNWPALGVQATEKQMHFKYHGIQQDIKVTFDRTVVDIMKDYPFIHEYAYLETPLSGTLRSSLLPQLRRYLEPLDERQRIELLVSFTRSAFEYKEDNEYFGHSKPMVPEELFGYSFSDCEDRSALFFALVRDLLNMPMAVVAYDDHLTIAVGTDNITGDSFTYEGKRYVFCDPTGPKDSSRIGQIPPGYENKNFQIIGTYK
ncbi:hypothetical protein FUA23_18785 [Neolewinella aurantiaca]|uniref:Transglutaminase superfamily protein n=1 Tax=Neolewinella aurantiaca TaxID=2602767 RepID=A0A5C7F8R0_9BACT|nr:hypothetical protein [Neolewinella aurantiaca]TXF87042.1 hypothetical protein FUA23_18785 [Neolewinella aurantiaca]